jgi:hypothetical protein
MIYLSEYYTCREKSSSSFGLQRERRVRFERPAFAKWRCRRLAIPDGFICRPIFCSNLLVIVLRSKLMLTWKSPMIV